jgi:hypothetical protein
MQPAFIPARNNAYWVFLSLLSLVVMVLGGLATAKYGAGVASDSTKYLSVAQNLLNGNGLFDHRGSPLLSWPPLYPMIIAGVSGLTRLDVFVAAWYFNIFLLGLNLFLSGVILQRVFSKKILYAYLGVLFIFLSNPSLRIHSVISSDPMYLTMALVFLLAVEKYIRQKSYWAFAVIVILSALAPLERYVGLVIGTTAELVILIEHRKSLRTWLRDSIIVGLATILPIAWWLVIHNVMTYGSLWGLQSQIVDVGANVNLGLTKILHWFFPYVSFLMPILLRPVLVLATLILLLYMLNRKNGERFRHWMQDLAGQSTYPVMLHGIVYFTAVALTAITADHRDLYSDRYYFILLVPVVIVLIMTFDRLVLPHLRFSPRQMQFGWIVLFALWSIYPLYTMREYLSEASTQGEPSSYNMFNTRKYNQMQLVPEMKELSQQHPEAILYSNYVDAVWFYTRHPVSLLPFVTENPSQSYAGWPHSKPGYIIWFEPNEYKHYLSPRQIRDFANVELVYQGTGGKIYYVQAR